MISVKGLVVRSNETHNVDGIDVQRITIEEKKKKILCLLSGEQTRKVQAGDYAEVQGVLKKFNAKDRSFGKYITVTKLEKLETEQILKKEI